MKSININESFIELKNHKTGDKYFFSSENGLYEFLKWRNEKPGSKEEDVPNFITAIAKSWIGKHFKPGEGEQCCYFVREVLKEAGIDIGVTKNPSDGFLPTGEGFANSLAGDDIGIKIETISELKPGDLVFFHNTYIKNDGSSWPEGTITHIGIYVGDGFMVHRPTYTRPVEKANLYNYGHFSEGRRLYL